MRLSNPSYLIVLIDLALVISDPYASADHNCETLPVNYEY